MNRFKPSLAVLLLLLGLVVLPVEGWLVRREHRRALSALAALEQKKQERDWLARQSPAPQSGNTAAIAAAVAATQGRLARWHEVTGANRGAAEPAPVSPVEGYFAVTQFGQRLRERATRAKVALKPEEHFGFAGFAREGPGAGLLPTVHRQVHFAEYLVGTLLDAGPPALLSVKRNAPDPATDATQPGGEADYFSLPPGLSVGEPGLVDTVAFRLEFTGGTAVLRQFLNDLARSPRTVLVRTVEAEPLASPPPARSPAGAEAGPATRAGLSRFVVMVEVPLVSVTGGTSP